jgi:CRP/FNR family transcriptional regulator
MQRLLDPLPFKFPNARDATRAPPTPLVSIRDSASHCQTCCTRDYCLPVALTSDQLQQFDGLISKRIRLRKNDALFRTGDAFCALYSIRYGSVKTTILTEDGWEQVSGYHILGEIIGFDAIGTHTHGVGATALEDTEVCALPFKSIEDFHGRCQCCNTISTN